MFDRGDGEFPDLEFDAEWDRWDIREIVDFLEWDLEAEGAVSGRSNTVRRDERYYGGGLVTASAGTFLEQPFDALSIGWNLDGGSVRLAPLTADFRGGKAEGELTIDLVDWTMEGAVTGRDYPLAPGLELDWIALRSDFRAEIGGDLEVPALRLEGRIPAVAVLDVPLGPGASRLRFRASVSRRAARWIPEPRPSASPGRWRPKRPERSPCGSWTSRRSWSPSPRRRGSRSRSTGRASSASRIPSTSG